MIDLILKGGDFWWDWNVFKSIILMLGIGALFIIPALIFSGKIIKGYSSNIGLFIIVGLLVTIMIVGAIVLSIKL